MADQAPSPSLARARDGHVWAIVVAAGAGNRFGGAKQYAPLAGERVVDRSLAAARAVADGVVLVVSPERLGDPEAVADHVVAGGPSRSASVRAGLGAVPPDAEVIVVHDAARPLAPSSLFHAVVDAVRNGADAVVPAIAVADTLRTIEGAPVDRDRLVAVQTPQGFAADVLRRAHEGNADATDDATLAEAVGASVTLVPGDPRNFKITEPGDLAVAEALAGGAGHQPAFRVGQGFDVHRLGEDPERPLVLGGVRFAGPGLAGHSDGDVIAHACADALLGAAGLGDIGVMFPDTDPVWAGADSVVLLGEVARRLRAAGFRPANIDCSVVLDSPRLAPQRQAMESRLGEAVGAPVTVKGRSTEGLGALGRGEGIACFANALVLVEGGS